MAPIFTFDDVNQIINVELLGTLGETITEVTVQQIIDAVRDWEDEVWNEDVEDFIAASGKEDLGGGVYVGITLKLIDWKIKFASRPGPSWIMCNVSGGNLVAYDSGLGAYVFPIQNSSFTNGYIARSSSATLLQQTTLEYATFNGGVTIDVISGAPGTAYPLGTPGNPVDNLTDAQSIATFRGFTKLYILGDITFAAIANIDGYTVVGETMDDSTFTLTAGVSTIGTKFEDCYIVGVVSGAIEAHHCKIDAVTNIGSLVNDTTFHNCVLEGAMQLSAANTQLTIFLECWSAIPGNPPTLDVNNSTGLFVFREYSGGIILDNITAGQQCSLDFVSGRLIFNPNVTNLICRVRGMVRVVNNSILAGGSIDLSGINLPETSFGGFVWIDVVNGEPGTVFPIGTPTRPVDNILDAWTIASAFNLRSYKICGSIILDQAYTDWNFAGTSSVMNDVIDLNGQDITGSQFNKLSISGTMVATVLPQFIDCYITNLTGANCIIYHCGILGTITLAAAPGAVLSCVATAVSYPSTIIDINGAGQTFTGEIDGNVQFINAGVGSLIRVTGKDGIIDFAVSCVAGSSAIISGNARLTNSAPAMFIIDNTQFSNETVVDGVWDESNAAHLAAGSTGKSLSDAASGAAPAVVAAAVWDEPMVGHVIPGSAGDELEFMRRFFTNKKVWDDVLKQWDIYDDTGVVVIYNWKPHVKSGADVTMPVDAFANSDKVV